MTRLHQPQLTFSPTMLSMTRSSGPPLFFFSLTFFLLLGAATTVSSAERCFLEQEYCGVVSGQCLVRRGKVRTIELQTNHQQSFHNHGEGPCYNFTTTYSGPFNICLIISIVS